MGLFDKIRGLFNPEIIKEFNGLIANYYEAIHNWSNKTIEIKAKSFDKLSFKEKKIIVSHKQDILKIDEKIRQERENRRKYDSIKKEFPLGCKYFEENCLDYGDDKILKVISNAELIEKYQGVCLKYDFLKRLYPLGLPYFEKVTFNDDGKNVELSIEEIIEREEDIKQFEYQERKRLEDENKEKERIRKAIYKDEADEYKDEADDIKKLLNDNGIKYFFHFTSRENLSSIKKYGGLYSWDYLKKNNIEIRDKGGDDLSEMLDMRYGLQDYVRLSFCESHPMAYKKMCQGTDIVVLKISTHVALFKL